MSGQVPVLGRREVEAWTDEQRRDVCICGAATCYEDDCPVCSALDPEWPCPYDDPSHPDTVEESTDPSGSDDTEGA